MKALYLTLAGIIMLALCAGWYAHTHRHAILARIRGHPVGLVIHHTATPPVMHGRPIDVARIDAMHAKRRFGVTDTDGQIYHIAYHYLVQQDGTILPGRPEHLRGAHAKGHTNTLGIALIGDFHRQSNAGRHGPLTPPLAQWQAAVALTRTLMARYGLPVSSVHLHGDVRATACPGDHFPRAAFFQAIAGMEH